MNLIVDPAWGAGQFALVRRFTESVHPLVRTRAVINRLLSAERPPLPAHRRSRGDLFVALSGREPEAGVRIREAVADHDDVRQVPAGRKTGLRHLSAGAAAL